MTYVNLLFLSGFTALFSPLFIVAWVQKRPAIALLCFAMLSKAMFAFVVEENVKYSFTIDNYTYEQRSWTLAQLGTGTDLSTLQDGPVAAPFNFYEKYLATIFKVFGYTPFLSVLLNVLFSGFAIGVTALLAKEMFPSNALMVRTLAILSMYPSLFVWSSVNIRDPLFLLAAVGCIYLLVRIGKNGTRIFTHAPLAVLCFYVLVALRPYYWKIFVPAFVGAVFLTGVFRLFFKKSSILLFVSLLLMTVVAAALAVQELFPVQLTEWLGYLQDTRAAFSNIGTDDFAQSSFAIHYKFENIWKVLVFVPYSLIFFLFAPFPWDISTSLQALSLPEVFSVYLLTIPAVKGIRIAWKLNSSYTLFLLVMVFVISAGYSVSVSNVGTLFRHRSLAFLLLSIFVALGLRDVWEKNISPIFKT